MWRCALKRLQEEVESFYGFTARLDYPKQVSVQKRLSGCVWFLLDKTQLISSEGGKFEATLM